MPEWGQVVPHIAPWLEMTTTKNFLGESGPCKTNLEAKANCNCVVKKCGFVAEIFHCFLFYFSFFGFISYFTSWVISQPLERGYVAF